MNESIFIHTGRALCITLNNSRLHVFKNYLVEISLHFMTQLHRISVDDIKNVHI